MDLSGDVPLPGCLETNSLSELRSTRPERDEPNLEGIRERCLTRKPCKEAIFFFRLKVAQRERMCKRLYLNDFAELSCIDKDREILFAFRLELRNSIGEYPVKSIECLSAISPVCRGCIPIACHLFKSCFPVYVFQGESIS